jgi:hypothetical protein
MGPIRNPNWSTSGMRVTLSYPEADLEGACAPPPKIRKAYVMQR